MLMEQRSKRQIAEPGWYNALTLSERLPNLEGSLQHSSSFTAAGHKRLSRWQQQSPFATRSDLFQAKLMAEQVTEAQLLGLLSEPVNDLQERIL